MQDLLIVSDQQRAVFCSCSSQSRDFAEAASAAGRRWCKPTPWSFKTQHEPWREQPNHEAFVLLINPLFEMINGCALARLLAFRGPGGDVEDKAAAVVPAPFSTALK